MSTPQLVEHFFRHEYGRLVASLSRRVGVQHLAAVEDAAQGALEKALAMWPAGGLPEEPSAWLFTVALRQVLGELRQGSSRRRLLDAHAAPTESDAPVAVFLAGEVPDDLLRLLFVCADDGLPAVSRLVIALKTLCGFSVGEIALRLFLSEDNVYKRLSRARKRLREHPLELEHLDHQQVSSRLPSVHAILYLLFTEGHLSSHAERALRRELCDEALRLALVLAEHPAAGTPETCALVALMHLHLSRMGARQDPAGGLLLLEEQDRSLWDRDALQAGMEWLARSARGDTFSRYHAEARIAAAHGLAPSFAETPWEDVVTAYALLEQVAPSPVHRLNRALAVAEARGPEAGLAVVEDAQSSPGRGLGDFQRAAVLADLHRRAGHPLRAQHYRDLAVASAPTPAIAALLHRRLAG